jgi:hypothetical protein
MLGERCSSCDGSHIDCSYGASVAHRFSPRVCSAGGKSPVPEQSQIATPVQPERTYDDPNRLDRSSVPFAPVPHPYARFARVLASLSGKLRFDSRIVLPRSLGARQVRRDQSLN